VFPSPHPHHFGPKSSFGIPPNCISCHHWPHLLDISERIARTMLSQDVCPSVCLYSIETATHTLKLFSPSGSHTIIILFLYQMVRQYADRDPSGGIECKGGINFWPTDRSGLCHRKSVCLSVRLSVTLVYCGQTA